MNFFFKNLLKAVVILLIVFISFYFFFFFYKICYCSFVNYFYFKNYVLDFNNYLKIFFFLLLFKEFLVYFVIYIYIYMCYYFFLFVILLLLLLLLSIFFLKMVNFFLSRILYYYFFRLKLNNFKFFIFFNSNEKSWINFLIEKKDKYPFKKFFSQNTRTEDIFFSLFMLFFEVNKNTLIFKVNFDENKNNDKKTFEKVFYKYVTILKTYQILYSINENESDETMLNFLNFFLKRNELNTIPSEIVQFLKVRSINIDSKKLKQFKNLSKNSGLNDLKLFLLNSGLDFLFGDLIQKIDSFQKLKKNILSYRQFLWTFFSLFLSFNFNKKNNFYISREYDLNLVDLEILFEFFYDLGLKEESKIVEFKNDPLFLYKRNIEFLKKKYGKKILNELLNKEDHKQAKKVNIINYRNVEDNLNLGLEDKKKEQVKIEEEFENDEDKFLKDLLFILLKSYHRRYFEKDYFKRNLKGDIKITNKRNY